MEGVKKGAFDLAQADVKFNNWLQEKEKAVQAKKDKLTAGFNEEMRKRLKAESKINEARQNEIAKKNAAAAAKAQEAESETNEAGAEA